MNAPEFGEQRAENIGEREIYASWAGIDHGPAFDFARLKLAGRPLSEMLQEAGMEDARGLYGEVLDYLGQQDDPRKRSLIVEAIAKAARDGIRERKGAAEGASRWEDYDGVVFDQIKIKLKEAGLEPGKREDSAI